MSLLSLLHSLSFERKFASLLIIVMSIQIVPIEGFEVSFIKVGIMAVSLFIFVYKAPFLSKAFWFGLFYWLACFLISFNREYFRFSTLGYFGLFVIAYIVFYNLVYCGAFNTSGFKKLLEIYIKVSFIVLILQQISILVGLQNMPVFNLVSQSTYYKWNRLPVLTCEPSHAARVITCFMLAWIRCVEIEQKEKVAIPQLFSIANRKITICYLYLVLFMGSGTAWIGFVIICLYFIRIKSFWYVLPAIALLFSIYMYIGNNEQLNRAIAAVEVTFSGDVEKITDTDGSASIRIVPLVNTILRTDLRKKESWIGKGTISKEDAGNAWKDLHRKIPIVEDYGLIGLLFSLLFLYNCVIRSFFSLETLCFVILLGDIGNRYYAWGILFVFTVIKYLYENRKVTYE